MDHSHLPPLDGRFIRAYLNDTTAGRSHGKLEPMETPSGVTAVWAVLGFCMALVAVGIIVAWEYRDLWKDLVG